MGDVILGGFPVADSVLEECLVQAVDQYWDFVKKDKGLKVGQATFYAEQSLDRAVSTEQTYEALERLVGEGRLSKEIGVFRVTKMTLDPDLDEEKPPVRRNECAPCSRYFPGPGT